MAVFKVASGTRKNFYTNVKPNNPNLIRIKELWVDTKTGYTYFIYDDKDELFDFSNNLFYNNNIGIEDNIFLNDIDPIWKMK